MKERLEFLERAKKREEMQKGRRQVLLRTPK